MHITSYKYAIVSENMMKKALANERQNAEYFNYDELLPPLHFAINICPDA